MDPQVVPNAVLAEGLTKLLEVSRVTLCGSATKAPGESILSWVFTTIKAIQLRKEGGAPGNYWYVY